MSIKPRALLRVLSLLCIITTLVLFRVGRYQEDSAREREATNWSVSGAEAAEIQPTVQTTQATSATTTTIPHLKYKVPDTRPEMPATSEATTTTVPATTAAPTTEAVSLPVPPESVATDDVFGRIAIPRLGIPNEHLPVVPLLEGYVDNDPATEDQVFALDHGTAHWPGTSLPGQGGNVVIGGHRTSYMRPFYDLNAMQQGDEIEVTTDWGIYTYLVYRVELEVPADSPEAEEIMKRTYFMTQSDRPGETVSVYACTPRGSISHRIIVQGDLVKVNGQDV